MKKVIIPVMILGISSAYAGVLPTGHSYYNNTEINRTTVPAHTKVQDNRRPTQFYISAKGGYNYIWGWLYTDDDNDKGFTFSNGRPIFSGTLGVDFNYDPSIRIEFEVANMSKSEVKFDDNWDLGLQAKLGYTSYMLNVIPYFKINDNINFDLIIGLGAANLNISNAGADDYIDFKAGNIAFAANFGIGLDIKLTDSLSFLPELKYNFLATTVKYSIAIPYFGYYESEENSLIMHNFQLMGGLKYTF